MEKMNVIWVLVLVGVVGVLIFALSPHNPPQVSSVPAPVSQEKPKAQVALEESGLTDVQLGDHEFLSCSRDDSSFTSYRFTAKNGEKVVQGKACCGLVFKSCTIRY